MIKLKIEKHCHECSSFKAETMTTKLYDEHEVSEIRTIIHCENRGLCGQLIERFKGGEF